MLEELGVPYTLKLIDINKGEQKKPGFLKLNPNHKIPVLVDGKTVIFESGAILIYLAEKFAKKSGKLLPAKGAKRYEVLEWLMFQMASVGPMFGQANHFNKHASEVVPYGIERYNAEAKRLVGVLNGKLKKSKYITSDYSIADIATWPWVRSYHDKIEFKKYPALAKWYKLMEERPATHAAIHKVTSARKEKK